eukprot:Gb_14856 [translate_table: standard]
MMDVPPSFERGIVREIPWALVVARGDGALHMGGVRGGNEGNGYLRGRERDRLNEHWGMGDYGLRGAFGSVRESGSSRDSLWDTGELGGDRCAGSNGVVSMDVTTGLVTNGGTTGGIDASGIWPILNAWEVKAEVSFKDAAPVCEEAHGWLDKDLSINKPRGIHQPTIGSLVSSVRGSPPSSPPLLQSQRWVEDQNVNDPFTIAIHLLWPSLGRMVRRIWQIFTLRAKIEGFNGAFRDSSGFTPSLKSITHVAWFRIARIWHHQPLFPSFLWTLRSPLRPVGSQGANTCPGSWGLMRVDLELGPCGDEWSRTTWRDLATSIPPYTF